MGTGRRIHAGYDVRGAAIPLAYDQFAKWEQINRTVTLGRGQQFSARIKKFSGDDSQTTSHNQPEPLVYVFVPLDFNPGLATRS